MSAFLVWTEYLSAGNKKEGGIKNTATKRFQAAVTSAADPPKKRDNEQCAQ